MIPASIKGKKPDKGLWPLYGMETIYVPASSGRPNPADLVRKLTRDELESLVLERLAAEDHSLANAIAFCFANTDAEERGKGQSLSFLAIPTISRLPSSRPRAWSRGSASSRATMKASCETTTRR